MCSILQSETRNDVIYLARHIKHAMSLKTSTSHILCKLDTSQSPVFYWTLCINAPITSVIILYCISIYTNVTLQHTFFKVFD